MLAVVFFCQYFVSQAWAQTEQAAITGTVTDATGAAVPQATVTATNVNTRVSAVAETNTLGYYNIPYLPIGQYTVKVEKAGFQGATVSGIALRINLIATINVELAVGGVQQEVTVRSTSVLLEQQQAALGQNIETTAILQLPNLGLNPYSLVKLTPGVLPNTGVQGIVQGGRAGTTEVLLDGADTRASCCSNLTYTPPLEAVQEFKLVTSNYSAEYGRSGGGALIAVGKMGTNEMHGSLYEFLRNDKINANGWTNNSVGTSRTAFRYNQYGGTAGGPVFIPKVYNGRNRTFFYINVEATRQRSPDNLQATIPTALERAGDFSHTTTSNGTPITIYDPATTMPNPANPGAYIRQPFPGNVIPQGRISPFANKILDYFPLPNRSTIVNNYVQANNRKSDVAKWFYRIDHNIGTKNRLYFRHGLQNNNAGDSPWPNIAFPGTGINAQGDSSRARNQNALLSDTVTFLPTLVGEFKGSFNRSQTTAIPRSQGFDPTTLGLPAVVNQTQNPSRFPEFDITDVTNSLGEGPSLGPARASYQNYNDNNFQGQAAITWMKGAHSLKAGFEALFLQFNVNRPDWPSGDFQFSRVYTQGPDPNTASATSGYGVATLLLGVPTGATASVNRAPAASQHAWAWYVQDDWKVTRKLTVNLGLRYEYQTPWTERYNQLGIFDPNGTDPLTGRKGVLAFVGTPGAPAGRYDAKPNKLNFAPRVGLAYQFLKNTVVRAGYGLFFFPGSGGIGAGPSDLGNGFQVNTSMYLGPPNPAPNTPPAGATIANVFSTGLLYPPSTGVGGGIGAPFPEWITPMTQNWNLSIQHSFGGDTMVEAAYTGNRGEHIWFNLARDVADPAQYLSMGNALNTLVPNPFYGVITTGSLSAPTVRASQLLLPWPHYTSVGSTRASNGDSFYHAFEARVERRMAHGLMVQAAYTFSKLIDTVPERFIWRSTNIANPLNLKQSRSLSDNDRPHV
ncbi:MAG TPA: TonB-dependent receptor, partial [Bryobacteraceae bacterium]|nr:TonB-dependent receptor [Bryobacteraceae bacterium]